MKAFAAARKLAPSILRDLSHEQYLSDEFSGPEDETESRDAWTVRCAVAAKMPTDPKSLAKLKFLEVLSPAWRSPVVRIFPPAYNRPNYNPLAVFSSHSRLRGICVRPKVAQPAIHSCVVGPFLRPHSQSRPI